MSGYIGSNLVGQNTQIRSVVNATAGQTALVSSGYQPGYIDIFRILADGTTRKLLNGVNFTATSSPNITLTTPAVSGDRYELISYLPTDAGWVVPPIASQAEAIDGTDNIKLMTPLRTEQAIKDAFPEVMPNPSATGLVGAYELPSDASYNIIDDALGKMVAISSRSGVTFTRLNTIPQYDPSNGLPYIDIRLQGTPTAAIASSAAIFSFNLNLPPVPATWNVVLTTRKLSGLSLTGGIFANLAVISDPTNLVPANGEFNTISPKEIDFIARTETLPPQPPSQGVSILRRVYVSWTFPVGVAINEVYRIYDIKVVRNIPTKAYKLLRETDARKLVKSDSALLDKKLKNEGGTILQDTDIDNEIGRKLLNRVYVGWDTATVDIDLSGLWFYNKLIFEYENLLPATNATQLFLRVSYDGGTSFVTTGGYAYAGRTQLSTIASSANVGSPSNTVFILNAGASVSNLYERGGISGNFTIKTRSTYLWNLNTSVFTDIPMGITAQSRYLRSDGIFASDDIQGALLPGPRTSAGVAQGQFAGQVSGPTTVRLLFSSGLIAASAGDIRIYGEI